MRLLSLFAVSLLSSCIPIAVDQSGRDRFRILYDTAIRSLSDGDYHATARYLRAAVQIDSTHANALQILGSYSSCLLAIAGPAHHGVMLTLQAWFLWS